MAKLIGFQHGAPIQAAAGWQEEVLTPVGLMLSAGAVLGGWVLGNIVGESWKEGGPRLLEVTKLPGYKGSDLDEFLGLCGLTAGLLITGNFVQDTVKEYGLTKTLLYSAGAVAFVAAGRAIRNVE